MPERTAPIHIRRTYSTGQQIAKGVAAIVIAVATPLPALAGETAPSTAVASPYRLAAPPQPFKLADPSPYRLDERYRPAPEPAPELAAKPYSRDIDAAARAASLEPALVHALIHVESRHRQGAVSPKGAVGLMQVMPGTALRYGIADPGRSVEANLAAGTRYLRDLMNQFDNRLDLALAAYNAGGGAVQRYANRIPPYRETRSYVPAVMTQYEEWRPRPPAPIEYLPGTRLVPLK